ncbi:MAG: hypothetical protein PVG38_11275 [Gammaproteobacteria bacterium]
MQILLLISSLLLGVAQADSIEMIQLENRPAAELIPVIEPLLDEGGSVTGQGFQLFLRTGEQNLEQIRRLVSQLDAAPKQLLISVFQGSERELRELRLSGGLRYRDDDATVSFGSGRPARGGASVTYSAGDTAVSGSVASTHRRLSDNPVHQLRVSEGSPGYIDTGESIPFFSGSTWLGGRRHTGVEYRDVTTGFYVLPRAHGDQVMLEISPHKNALSHSRGGAVDTQSASTTITGPLGRWIAIGGVAEEKSRSSSGIGRHRSTRSRSNDSIWIRADVVSE